MNDNIECCANCKYLISHAKGNIYGDIDNFCAFTGYFCTGIYKDRHTIKRFTPGGRELECRYTRKEKQ